MDEREVEEAEGRGESDGDATPETSESPAVVEVRFLRRTGLAWRGVAVVVAMVVMLNGRADGKESLVGMLDSCGDVQVKEMGEFKSRWGEKGKRKWEERGTEVESEQPTGSSRQLTGEKRVALPIKFVGRRYNNRAVGNFNSLPP